MADRILSARADDHGTTPVTAAGLRLIPAYPHHSASSSTKIFGELLAFSLCFMADLPSQASRRKADRKLYTSPQPTGVPPWRVAPRHFLPSS